MEDNKLIEMASDAMKNAYAPYSHFSVGAALVTDSGKIYTGCNVENASYGAVCCGERVAVFKAVSDGERKIEKIAIVSGGGEFTYPCGICRQVLSEFMDDDGEVILSNSKGKTFKLTQRELLPFAFKL